MTDFDKVCTDIIRGLDGNSEFSFEKKANVVAKKEKVVKITDTANLQKIASEIRKELAPVAISYKDLNSFIKEITNE